MGTHHLDFKPGGRIHFFDFKKEILNSALVFGPKTNPRLSFTYIIRGKMVQPRYLLAWTIVAAVISLNCDNCNAAMVKIGDRRPAMDLSNLDLDDMDKWLDDDSYDLNMVDRKLTPTKWLKRQVRQLWRALDQIKPRIKDNEDAIDSLEADVDMNKMGIQTNSKNITDNEEDIDDNEEAIGDNYDEIKMNEEKIENLTISVQEKIDLHAELIANNTNATKENEMMIEQNKVAIQANLDEILQLTNVPRQYLSFGGLDDENTVTEEVYLITVDELNNVTTACIIQRFLLHSKNLMLLNGMIHFLCAHRLEVELIRKGWIAILGIQQQILGYNLPPLALMELLVFKETFNQYKYLVWGFGSLQLKEILLEIQVICCKKMEHGYKKFGQIGLELKVV